MAKILDVFRGKLIYLKYLIKYHNKYKLTPRAKRSVEYFQKILLDENYTYSGYEEKLFWDFLNETMERYGYTRQQAAEEHLMILSLFS